jgi:small subunit ribosomal protein S5
MANTAPNSASPRGGRGPGGRGRGRGGEGGEGDQQRRGRGRGGEGGEREQRGRGRDRDGGREGREESELIDKLVHINRVAKVVKGGKRFSFAALVVVGDGRGRVGHGNGKAREVPEAIRKATEHAKRNMIRIPLREGRTLHHDVTGHYGAGKVILRTAAPGTGIIAGGPMRAIFETMGVQDVVAKSVGTANPHNMMKATLDALKHCMSPRSIAAKRGKKVGDIIARRSVGPAAAAATAAKE